MPSASQELRDLMKNWFGDPIGEEGPIRLLKNRGYQLTSGWCWLKPTPSHTVHEIEYLCILFLIEEWDFGGVVKTYPN